MIKADMIGTFRVGEDIAIALDAAQGDPNTVDTVTASIRSVQATSSGSFRFTGSPIAMSVAPRAASGGFPAGWTLSLPAATSATLAPGLYVIDAKLQTGTAIDVTERGALIELTETAFDS